MRLVTYNIQFGRGKDDRCDLGRIAGEVAGADVIAMQEVDRFWKRSGMVDQVAELVRLLEGYHWVYGPGLDLDAGFVGSGDVRHSRRRQFGNLLMSRAPILAARNHLLPKTGLVGQLSLQRSALEGVIACARQPVRFYSVHLAHVTSGERQRQVARLLEIHRGVAAEGGALSGFGDNPDWAEVGAPAPMADGAVVAGDFNMVPETPEYEMLVGSVNDIYGRVATVCGFVDAWLAAGNDPTDGITQVTQKRAGRVDYVFVGAALSERVRAARVDGDARGSDHQPLWVEIDL